MTDKELGTAAGEIFAKAFTLGYETGREYVPVGGRVLTAEQVEDVRALVWLDGRRNFDAFYRLRALFPATEPAEPAASEGVNCGANSVVLGWCTLSAQHEGLHTNGTYFWGQAPAPAEPAEEETKAEYPRTDGDFTVLGPEIFTDASGEFICWKGVNYVRQPEAASSPVVPAPTETEWQTWEAHRRRTRRRVRRR